MDRISNRTSRKNEIKMHKLELTTLDLACICKELGKGMHLSTIDLVDKYIDADGGWMLETSREALQELEDKYNEIHHKFCIEVSKLIDETFKNTHLLSSVDGFSLNSDK